MPRAPRAAESVNLQAREHGRGQARGPEINHDDLTNCVKAMISEPEYTDKDFVNARILLCDSRGFKSYERQSRYHIGTHLKNVEYLVRHSEFPGKWSACIRSLQDAMTEVGDGPIVLCFYCKSGKHRSVALAALMYHLARKSPPKFEKVRLWHAMRGYWEAPGCCNECADCSMGRLLRSPVVNEALKRVPF